MKTSVIIPTLNRPETALRLLANLALQSVLPDEIILLEGGTTKWNAHDFPAVFPRALHPSL